MDDEARILTALTRHQGLFRLDREELGHQLVDIAADGTRETFDGERFPDASPWPELSSEYARWKSFHFPGKPIGVREGNLRNDTEFDGVREITPDEASYTFGQSEIARNEAAWMTQGDPFRNRPERGFVGLTESSRSKVQTVLSNHLKENV